MEPKSRIITISMCIGGFLIPVGVMALSYSYIIMKLKARKKMQQDYEGNKMPSLLSNEDKKVELNETISKEKPFNDEPTSTSISKKKNDESIKPIKKTQTKNVKDDKKINLFIKSELKATKNALLIITLFTIAWFPYTIVSLIAQFSENRHLYVNPYTTTITALFAKSSAIYNPIVYALTNRKFKLKLGQAFPYFGRTIPILRRSFMSSSFLSGTFRRPGSTNAPSGSLKLHKLNRTKTLNNSTTERKNE